MSDLAGTGLHDADAAAERSASEEQTIGPAQFLGGYMVLSQVGHGDMGQVYAAYDAKLDRRVALKLLHAQSNAGDREQLMREAKALARLSHPHVVTVHEVDEFDGRPLLSMEFVEGQTLKEWSREHPVGRDKDRTLKALQLLVQAGQGLAAAHAEALVHRDFKPSNVLAGADGRVCVAEFGLARAVEYKADRSAEEIGDADLNTPLPRTGTALGNPAYMAPEQFAGKRVDARADQFSFCVTAWEVLFGVRPYQGKNVDDLLAAFRRDPLAPTDGVAVSEGVEQALRRGLAIAPSARHRSIEPLLKELQCEVDMLRDRATPRRRWRAWAIPGPRGAAGSGRIRHVQVEHRSFDTGVCRRGRCDRRGLER